MTTIRRAEPGDAFAIAQVHMESWRTTYRGLVPDEYLSGLSVARRAVGRARILEAAGRGEGMVYVAEDEQGEVVAFADGGPERTGDPEYRGELYAIYSLQARQRRGLGRALVSAVAGDLAAMGFGSMLVWVLATNPARGFYEALGGKVLRSQPIEVGGAVLEEVAYGWADIGPLAR